MNTLLQPAPTLPRLVRLSRRPPSIELIEVRHGYRARGTFCLSLLVHAFAVFSIIYLGRHTFLRPSITLAPPPVVSSDSVIFLPSLGGGTNGSGEQGGGQGNEGKVSSGVRARSRQGFAYPGPQPVLSNPEQAKLGVLTLLQPSFENLPRLQHFIELPNIVKPPASTAASETKGPTLVVKSEIVALRAPENPITPPKLVVPLAPDSGMASLIDIKPRLPQRAIPDPVKVSELAGATRNPQGLLVLNAVPPPPDVRSLVPHAEARSLFAVAPGEATVIAAPAAGNESGRQSEAAAGTGARTDIRSGDALAEAASGGPNSNSHVHESGSGSGGRYGDGKGVGINAESLGGGTGRGDASASSLGTGSARGTGSGGGGGSAPGGGHFTGITIQGGRYGHNSATMLDRSPAPHQTSYNTTVISTASSGGGLPDIGVFRNEKVYTVYLDMRSTNDDPAPSWTLQYSLLQPRTPGEGGIVSGTPSPPYAMLKQIPEFSPELLHNPHLILVSAVLDVTGKLEDVTVRQSSNEALNPPLIEALKNWNFQPAEIAGRPVALKVLFGIRLATSHSHP